ncbi:hypothetical protein Tco_0566168 [Tanacetum coccineum]
MQGRQTQSYVGNFSNGNDHIARQCTQPTKVQNSAWFKEKMLLAQVQEAILADTGDRVDHSQEKESLLQTFTVFKNESKEKESKYIDKDIDLEKKIKEPDNIVYKVGQSAQTVHILTKPQVFYDDTHKQALGYQNSLYLKKSQWIKPILYDGSVISSQHDIIPVIADEETLILEEAPRELPKVSLVNTSLKKLKYHLGKFDTMVKKHSTPDAIIEGEWDFENGLLNELSEVKMVFNQMEAAVDKCSIDKKLFEIEKKELKLENERLLEHIICQNVVNIIMHADIKSVNLLVSQDLVHTVVNSLAINNDYQSMERSYIEEYEKNLKLAAEISQMNELSKTCSRLKQRSQLQANDTPISNLKKHIQELKRKSVVDCREYVIKPKVTSLVGYKLDLETVSSKLKNNREAHIDYIKITKANAGTLCDIVEQARTLNPLDNVLAYACMYTKQIQELLVYVSDTCPGSTLKSEKLVDVTPMNKARKVTFVKTTKSVKSIKKKKWKPTGKMFKNVGYKWVPTGRTFTLVGNKYPSTRFTSTKIVPPRKPVKSNVMKNIKPSSTSQWRPRETKHVCSSSEPRIVEARTTNHLEPNKNRGSNVSISPCSSSVECMSYKSYLGFRLHQLTPGYISSGLVQNPVSPTPYVPPSKKDYEILFQLLFDEYFNLLPRAISLDPVAVAAPRAVDRAGSPSSTTIDQDVPSPSNSPTNQEI